MACVLDQPLALVIPHGGTTLMCPDHFGGHFIRGIPIGDFPDLPGTIDPWVDQCICGKPYWSTISMVCPVHPNGPAKAFKAEPINLPYVSFSTTQPTVYFKKLHPEAQVPTYAHDGDAGADLYAIEDTSLLSGKILFVEVGLSIEIPYGYEAQIRPRSSMGKRGIIIPNSPGTVDHGFKGNLGVLLLNLKDTTYEIKKGDRIAQMVVAPVSKAIFAERAELTASARGTGGFGSTGK